MKAFNLLDINHQLENYQNLANQVLDAKTWNLYNIVPVLYCTVSKFWILSIQALLFHQDNGLELRPYSDSSQEKKLRYAFKVMVKHTVLPVEI